MTHDKPKTLQAEHHQLDRRDYQAAVITAGLGVLNSIDLFTQQRLRLKNWKYYLQEESVVGYHGFGRNQQLWLCTLPRKLNFMGTVVFGMQINSLLLYRVRILMGSVAVNTHICRTVNPKNTFHFFQKSMKSALNRRLHWIIEGVGTEDHPYSIR